MHTYAFTLHCNIVWENTIADQFDWVRLDQRRCKYLETRRSVIPIRSILKEPVNMLAINQLLGAFPLLFADLDDHELWYSTCQEALHRFQIHPVVVRAHERLAAFFLNKGMNNPLIQSHPRPTSNKQVASARVKLAVSIGEPMDSDFTQVLKPFLFKGKWYDVGDWVYIDDPASLKRLRKDGSVKGDEREVSVHVLDSQPVSNEEYKKILTEANAEPHEVLQLLDGKWHTEGSEPVEVDWVEEE